MAYDGIKGMTVLKTSQRRRGRRRRLATRLFLERNGNLPSTDTNTEAKIMSAKVFGASHHVARILTRRIHSSFVCVVHRNDNGGKKQQLYHITA